MKQLVEPFCKTSVNVSVMIIVIIDNKSRGQLRCGEDRGAHGGTTGKVEFMLGYSR